MALILFSVCAILWCPLIDAFLVYYMFSCFFLFFLPLPLPPSFSSPLSSPPRPLPPFSPPFQLKGIDYRFWENLVKVGREKYEVCLSEGTSRIIRTYWTQFMSQHHTILSFYHAETLKYMTEDVFTIVEGNYIESRIIGILSRVNTLEYSLEESFNTSAGLKQLQLSRINLSMEIN